MHLSLFLSLAGGEFRPITVAEKAELLPKRDAIELNQAQVDTLLGYKVESDFITDALTRLGCTVTVKAEGEWYII